MHLAPHRGFFIGNLQERYTVGVFLENYWLWFRKPIHAVCLSYLLQHMFGAFPELIQTVFSLDEIHRLFGPPLFSRADSPSVLA